VVVNNVAHHGLYGGLLWRPLHFPVTFSDCTHSVFPGAETNKRIKSDGLPGTGSKWDGMERYEIPKLSPAG